MIAQEETVVLLTFTDRAADLKNQDDLDDLMSAAHEMGFVGEQVDSAEHDPVDVY